jgi:tetratricopeptide (TPR) repeat protein
MPRISLLPFWIPMSLCLVVAGCGMQSDASQDASKPLPIASSPPVQPFPPETLYSLLVAETAANRGQLDVALANYYQQSYKTRDIAVVRRATLLAQHLNASQAALDLANLWSDIDPKNPEPVYLAGQYLVAFQRLDLAMQKSRSLLEMDAQTLFVSIASSPAASEKNQLNVLKQEYASLIQKYPDSVELLLGNAVLLELQDDYSNSLESIQQALKIDSKNLQARLFEVDMLYKSGRPDKAVTRMEEIVNDDPENNRLRLQYARLLADQDLEKARTQFDYMAQTNSLEPELLLARAIVNYRLKDYVQAKDLFEQLLFLKKYTDTGHFYLGEIEMANQKPGKALEHYRRVVGGNEYLPATIRAFNLMVEQNQRLEGQQWLAEQRRLHPDLAMNLYLIEADVLLQQKDMPRSLAAMNEAVQKYPDRVELYYSRSLLLEKMNNKAAAESDLRFVLANQPDNVDALNALGYLLADNNQELDDAFRFISRALALRPEDPAILDSFGWVLYRMGQLEESLLRLKKAYALHPNDEVAAHLGEVLWTIGKRKEAEDIWNQGLKQNANSGFIDETRKRMHSNIK